MTSPTGYGQQQQRPCAPAQADAPSNSLGNVSLNEPPCQPAEPPRAQQAPPPPPHNTLPLLLLLVHPPLLLSTDAGSSEPGKAAASAASARRSAESQATLDKWCDTVGMIVANRTAGDSAVLTALGDGLASNGWIEAAHICYLLSPQTSLANGLGSPGSRVVLIGSMPSPVTGIYLESLKLVEFVFSLAPTVKGLDAFVGLPHLQAFRLYHACALADAGHIPQALEYTEAIVNTFKLATKPNPFYHLRLVAQVKILGERLTAAPGTRKVAKQAMNGQSIGPFSHYSSISPGSTSGSAPRSALVSEGARPPDSGALVTAEPEQAAALARSAARQARTVQDAPRSLFVPRRLCRLRLQPHCASALTVVHSTPPAHRSPAGPLAAGASADAETGPTVAQNLTASPSSKSDAGSQRPHFAAVDEPLAEDDLGFISPMAQYTPSVSPSPSFNRPSAAGQPMSHRRMTAEVGRGRRSHPWRGPLAAAIRPRRVVVSLHL
ncbi:hypothetical protein JCM5296_001217 [Sporobolomyces johnsonii]